MTAARKLGMEDLQPGACACLRVTPAGRHSQLGEVLRPLRATRGTHPPGGLPVSTRTFPNRAPVRLRIRQSSSMTTDAVVHESV